MLALAMALGLAVALGLVDTLRASTMWVAELRGSISPAVALGPAIVKGLADIRPSRPWQCQQCGVEVLRDSIRLQSHNFARKCYDTSAVVI